MAISAIPKPLATGAVRGWHLVFLYSVIFIATSIIARKLTLKWSVDPEYEFALRTLLANGLSAALTIVIAVIVPELRRSIPLLYSAGNGRTLSPTDAAIVIALMLTWALGAAKILIFLPLLSWHPELFSTFGFQERMPSIGTAYLSLTLIASTLVAPLAEELLFRGYFQNLFVHRWGLWRGVVMSAFVFGLPHFQAAPFAMVAGLFFSMIYLRYGTLWPGTVLHGLHNLLVSPLLPLMSAFAVKPRADVTSLSHWVPELVLTVAFFPLLFLFWRRFRPTA